MSGITPVTFIGGDEGDWRVASVRAISGVPLPSASRLAVRAGHISDTSPPHGAWKLRGTAGHYRYVERAERDRLIAVQPSLGRPDAIEAALIPIKKTAAWWELAHDERRAIFESTSHHIAEGMRYLPAIARRLYHSRDLGEPFDFLTWFEFAPENADRFEDLVTMLRATAEWKYVEREVDIRLVR